MTSFRIVIVDKDHPLELAEDERVVDDRWLFEAGESEGNPRKAYSVRKGPPEVREPSPDTAALVDAFGQITAMVREITGLRPPAGQVHPFEVVPDDGDPA